VIFGVGNYVAFHMRASGHAWREDIRRRPTVEQGREALAQFIGYDADPFEVELYESASDPRTLLIDRAQRSRAGQHARRVRRLKDCAKAVQSDGEGEQP
jgi:hypothetical protein